MPVRIAILGTGSLGSVVGGCLARGGEEVWMVGRRRDVVTAISTHGLHLVEDDGTTVVWPRATVDAEEVGDVDLVVVVVKAFDVAAALSAASSLLGRATTVLTLQNGLGVEEVAAGVVGRDRVLAGRTYVSGDAAAPGVVRAGIHGRPTVVGEPFGVDSGRAGAVAAAFGRGGLDTEVSPDIRSVIWQKLLVNVATGALAGITGLTYGSLYRLEGIQRTAHAAVREAVAVATACGVDLGEVDAEAVWQEARRGLPDDFRTSILQSLERGAPTEIAFINGAVVRTGSAAGVPTPVNATLEACVQGLEVSRRRVASSGSAAPR